MLKGLKLVFSSFLLYSISLIGSDLASAASLMSGEFTQNIKEFTWDFEINLAGANPDEQMIQAPSIPQGGFLSCQDENVLWFSQISIMNNVGNNDFNLMITPVHCKGEHGEGSSPVVTYKVDNIQAKYLDFFQNGIGFARISLDSQPHVTHQDVYSLSFAPIEQPRSPNPNIRLSLKGVHCSTESDEGNLKLLQQESTSCSSCSSDRCSIPEPSFIFGLSILGILGIAHSKGFKMSL